MAFTRMVVSTPDMEKRGRAPHGSPILIHATAEETGGAFGMWETFAPPGKGPAPHIHTREAEVFRVITGTFRFFCGDDVVEGGPGTVVTLPPNVSHHWINIGDSPGQMMAIVSPGGCEQIFIEIAKLDRPRPAEVAAIEKRFGIINEETRRLLD
jgi:quercetin dioxygenase-like cupin family protein